MGSDATTIALFAPSEPDVPGAGSVSVAVLPTESRMIPPLSSSEVLET